MNYIGRTLFWFKDGDQSLISINEDFFGIATLLNRLLNEIYEGKKIKFINVNFFSDLTYELHPILPKGTPYYFGGHLNFYGIFDPVQYGVLDQEGRKYYVWQKACDYIRIAALQTKNEQLAKAAEYALEKGKQYNLNPDFALLSETISFKNRQFEVSVWIRFREDGMYAVLVLKDVERIIFEKQIDKTRNGVEFFLEMYKALDFDGNDIIIKGRKDVEYLPLRVPIANVI